MIVLLNMLIAIMGDIFDEATERKVENRMSGMLKIMIEYVNLTVKEDDKKKVDEYRVVHEEN